MIIVTTDTGPATVVLGPDGTRVRVRSLARGPVLASTCESFDHLRLGPEARYAVTARAGAETVWYVLRGPLLAGELPDSPEHLATEGDLLLVRRGRGLHLAAGPLGAEVLCLTVGAGRRGAPPGGRRTAPRTRP